MWLKKRIVYIVVFSLLSLLFWYRLELLYAWQQLKGQLNIIYGAESIEQLIQENYFNQEELHKLNLIKEAKEFAVNYLGYQPTDNYTTFYEQNQQPILWAVTASRPFEMKAYQWKFPILGRFSYKGFFELELAEREREKLHALGYETAKREVAAWSTLGYFNDPVLSNMLQRTDGKLVELILHELTHHHIYIKDSVKFNENLASFIGYHATLLFLKSKYGQESQEIKDYVAEREKSKKMTQFMIQSAQSLDSLYRSFNNEQNENFKYQLRKQLFLSIAQSFDSLGFRLKDDKKMSEKYKELNNNHFLSLLRYHSIEDELEAHYTHQFDSDLKKMLAFYKENFSSI